VTPISTHCKTKWRSPKEKKEGGSNPGKLKRNVGGRGQGDGVRSATGALGFRWALCWSEKAFPYPIVGLTQKRKEGPEKGLAPTIKPGGELASSQPNIRIIGGRKAKDTFCRTMAKDLEEL